MAISIIDEYEAKKDLELKNLERERSELYGILKSFLPRVNNLIETANYIKFKTNIDISKFYGYHYENFIGFYTETGEEDSKITSIGIKLDNDGHYMWLFPDKITTTTTTPIDIKVKGYKMTISSYFDFENKVFNLLK